MKPAQQMRSYFDENAPSDRDFNGEGFKIMNEVYNTMIENGRGKDYIESNIVEEFEDEIDRRY